MVVESRSFDVGHKLGLPVHDDFLGLFHIVDVVQRLRSSWFLHEGNLGGANNALELKLYAFTLLSAGNEAQQSVIGELHHHVEITLTEKHLQSLEFSSEKASFDEGLCHVSLIALTTT